jgi:plasmid maintenance system killer protein
MGDKARVDELKKMLELGVISQSEFDTLSSQQGNLNQSGKSKWWKNKWFFVSTGLLFVTVILLYLFKGSPEKDATQLSKSFVACQLQNNLDYINALYDVNEKINRGEYKFVAEIDSELTIIDAHYQNQDFNNELIDGFTEYEKLESASLVNWKRTTSSGKEFWLLYDQKVESNAELKKSNKKLEALIAEVNENKLQLSIGSSEELNELKQFIFNRLESLFGNWKESYFDPYEYFSYKVEQFFGKQNTSPSDVQMYILQQRNIGSANQTPIYETLSLKSKVGADYIWDFATDYKFYNEENNSYMTCNKWYSVKINEQQKIIFFKEIKIENKKELSADEYNSLMMGE